MYQVVLVRTFLLVIGLLALLTATVFDSFAVRYFVRPLVQRIDARSGGKAQYPLGLIFMLEHGWARRLYNGAVGAGALGFWRYLGTPAGLAMLHRSH